jgi:hypothetical protein
MIICIVIVSHEKNDTLPPSAPNLLAISQSKPPERLGITEELREIGCWNCAGCVGYLQKCGLREIGIML